MGFQRTTEFIVLSSFEYGPCARLGVQGFLPRGFAGSMPPGGGSQNVCVCTRLSRISNPRRVICARLHVPFWNAKTFQNGTYKPYSLIFRQRVEREIPRLLAAFVVFPAV